MKLLSRLDWVIILCVLLLGGFGLAVIGSVMGNLLVPQLVFLLLGLVILVIFANIDYRLFTNFWWPVYIFSILALLVTFILGVESRGSVRWLEIFGFRLQLSELLKPFLLASVAAFLTRYPPVTLKRIAGLVPLLGIPLFLILKQPDLGSAIIFFLSFAAMVFVAGIKLPYLFGLGASATILAPLSMHFLKNYQKSRILSFFNPSADPLGSSYNAIQALIAVGSGMILGKGLGQGTQSHLLFLPERHTDFVFASLAEELGLVGVLVVLLAYFVILFRIIRILQKSEDLYTSVFLTGLAFIIFSQVFINVGMNVGLMPITGITLPLVSYGGSSVFSTMIILGLVENVSRNLHD